MLIRTNWYLTTNSHLLAMEPRTHSGQAEDCVRSDRTREVEEAR